MVISQKPQSSIFKSATVTGSPLPSAQLASYANQQIGGLNAGLGAGVLAGQAVSVGTQKALRKEPSPVALQSRKTMDSVKASSERMTKMAKVTALKKQASQRSGLSRNGQGGMYSGGDQPAASYSGTKWRSPVSDGIRPHERFGRGHSGEDYTGGNFSQKRIFAAATGKVIRVDSNAGWNGGWGNRIMIQHASGAISAYNHLPDGASRLKVGQVVDGGTYLGQMGSTGRSTGDHLHFEVWLNGKRVDPRQFY